MNVKWVFYCSNMFHFSFFILLKLISCTFKNAKIYILLHHGCKLSNLISVIHFSLS